MLTVKHFYMNIAVLSQVSLSKGQMEKKSVKETAVKERPVGRCYPGLHDYKASVLECGPDSTGFNSSCSYLKNTVVLGPYRATPHPTCVALASAIPSCPQTHTPTFSVASFIEIHGVQFKHHNYGWMGMTLGCYSWRGNCFSFGTLCAVCVFPFIFIFLQVPFTDRGGSLTTLQFLCQMLLYNRK